MPEEGLAQISGYVHVNKKFKLREASVQTWLFDERISGEIEWRPVLPGKTGTRSNIRS